MVTSVGYIAAIEARNRGELLDSVVGEPRDGEPFVKVSLPCGHVREWRGRGDVPDHTVECRCVEVPYRHYFILYTEEPYTMVSTQVGDRSYLIPVYDREETGGETYRGD